LSTTFKIAIERVEPLLRILIDAIPCRDFFVQHLDGAIGAKTAHNVLRCAKRLR
jgi:hypothetical protein